MFIPLPAYISQRCALQAKSLEAALKQRHDEELAALADTMEPTVECEGMHLSVSCTDGCVTVY